MPRHSSYFQDSSADRSITPAIPALRDKAFCIGLGRTGTTTFAECMRLLGSRHLSWDDSNFVLRRDLGLLAMIDEQLFATYLDRYDSADDHPIPQLYDRLSRLYPSARFVLTTRLSAETWAESIIKEFNCKKFNEGENTWYQGDLYGPDRKSRLVRRYEAHLVAVRGFFTDSPRLLEVCWERGDGWGELCAFLGVPAPAESFPHFNRARHLPPQEFVRDLIREGRYGKLLLYLKDQRDESLVHVTRNVLLSRLDRQLERHLNRQTTVGGKLIREAKRAFRFLADRLPTAPQRIVSSIRGRPDDTDKPIELAVCAIFRDEAQYLDEWLTFHHGVGVERFFLYNDRSTDDYRTVLAPWIEQGIVTLRDWPEKNQVDAFNDCLKQHRQQTKWIAFLDINEFLYSLTGVPVPEILHRYSDAAVVFVYWALFGSSGHAAAPNASVISSYRHCQGLRTAVRDEFDHGTPKAGDYVTGWSRDGKSIVRTAWVTAMNNHQPSHVRYGRVVDENGREMPRMARERRTCKQPFTYSTLRINHYWSKSLQELTRRTERGCVFDRSRPKKRLDRVMDREKDLNETLDETIQPLWQRITQATH